MTEKDAKKPAAGEKETLTHKQVSEYLKRHPDFFKDHNELYEFMLPPEVDHGGNVVDLQHHMLGKLQTGIKSLKNKYDGLIVSSRDNMSILHQVHEGALSLIRARTLEQLIEVITMDLPALFSVDVARLALESEAAEFYENKFGEQNSSGVAFLPQGTVSRAMGKDGAKEKQILLVSDTAQHFVYGFEQIFADCSGLVESCALLRMRLPSTQRDALLAFGVRVKDHFHEGQGTEMLSFLAQIVEHELDNCLQESGIGHLL